MKTSSLLIAFTAAALFGACGGGDDDDGDGGAGGSAPSGAAGGYGSDAENALSASCDSADACPEGLTCAFMCTVEHCPSNGPGAPHGCPSNGFCYVFDSNPDGYCVRTCTTDADCKAVNPELFCRESASTEGYGLKLCLTEFG